MAVKWPGFISIGMRMDKENFLKTGLLEQYVLGLTDERESEEVEQYAEAFPEIKAEIEAMRKAVDEYAKQYAVMPPGELEARVVEEADEKTTGSRTGDSSEGGIARSDGGRWGAWLARAIMVMLIILSFSFYQSKVAADRQYDALSREYRTFQQDCSRRHAQQEKLKEVYAFLNHEHTTPIRLLSTGLVPEAEAVAYFNEAQKKVFVNPTLLPPPPQGKTYQIWADVEGEMVSMGLIDGHSKGLQPVVFIDGTESLNITLEPEGGSEAPTVTLLYVNGKV